MLFQLRKYRKLKDEELIKQFNLTNSRDITHVLYERYGHLVLGLCIKYLKHIEDAEDLCASIFEKIPSLIEKHEIRYFKSWLYQVSKNECFMVIRKKKNYFTSVEIENRELEYPYDSEFNQYQEKQLELMETALLALKPDQQRCIDLFYLKEMSYTAISEELKMDFKTVKSHIQNGKRNLKILMSGNNE